MTTKATKRRQKQGAALYLGGSSATVGGMVAQKVGGNRENDAARKSYASQSKLLQASGNANRYRIHRTAELNDAVRTTKPEDQKIDPRVVGGSKAVKVRTTPKFRHDLVPTGAETRHLGETATRQLHEAKEAGYSAKKLARSGKRLRRGGLAVAAGSMVPVVVGGGMMENKDRRVRKSQDPFELAKAWGGLKQVESQYIKGKAAGTWMHKPKMPARGTGPGWAGYGPGELKGGLTRRGKAAVGAAAAVPVGGAVAVGHKKVSKALSPKKLAQAKARAKAAGRRYPNAYDNMKSAGKFDGVSKANPLRAARGVTTISTTATGTSARTRAGGWALKPKSEVKNGDSKMVTGGGLTGAGRYAVGTAAVAGAGAAGVAHNKVYRRRNETTTVKVKVRKAATMNDPFEISKVGMPGVPKLLGAAKGMFGGAGKVMTGPQASGHAAGVALRSKTIGAANSAGAKFKPLGAKLNGMSTGAKLGIAGGAGVAAGGAAGFGGGRKSSFGKAYAPSSLGALKGLGRAAHADSLHASFAAKQMPGAAQRAAKVRNAATVRAGGKNSVRAMLQAKSPTTASVALRSSKTPVTKGLTGHDVFGVEA